MKSAFSILFFSCISGLFAVHSSIAGQIKKEDPKQETKGKDEKPENITIKGEITKDDPFDVKMKKSHHKAHTVKMVPGFQYVIDMKTAFNEKANKQEFDAYLRLEDSKGNEISENDDYITTDSRIIFEPKKEDTYRVICTTLDDGFTGKYTLTVTSAKLGAGGIVGAVVNIKGQITANDPLYKNRNGSRHKVHTIKMFPGKTYTIDMKAGFDTYLFLENAQGGVLRSDDDGGDGLNSKIVFTPNLVGTYRIIATTFGQNATGNYTLTVTAQ